MAASGMYDLPHLLREPLLLRPLERSVRLTGTRNLCYIRFHPSHGLLQSTHGLLQLMQSRAALASTVALAATVCIVCIRECDRAGCGLMCV